MNVTFADVKRQVDELPIGYYAKRRVGMTVDASAESSYYNPATDEICISYKQICKGFEHADSENEAYKETAIRSMVYHELSHVIMTPGELFDYVHGSELRAVMNVFEDERIETVLRDFYMNVNFKKNVLYINGGKINPPTNAFSEFYNLVRFRAHNNEDFLREVRDIIKDFPDNFESDASDWWSRRNERGCKIREYVERVKALWNKIQKDWAKNGNSSSPSEDELQEMSDKINDESASGSGYDKNDKTDGGKNGNPNEQNGEGKGKQNGEGSDEGEGEQKGEGKNGEGEGDQTEQDGKAKSTRSHSDLEDAMERIEHSLKNGDGGKNSAMFQRSINKFRDTKTTEMLKSIIETFNKKNSNGNGTHGYSGIFNPRNVVNENYKYFDRRITSKGNNKFGKFHLNLFIDESGSFCNLQDSANTILQSLTEVERQNHNFSFDLICDSDGFREVDKNHRVIKAGGGNYISYDEVMNMMKKHTKKDAYTYNIVLHDGYVDQKGSKNFFLGWDRNNCTIIDTGDNREYFEDVKNARIVITPYKQLVVQLGEEVAKALQCAFR